MSANSTGRLVGKAKRISHRPARIDSRPTAHLESPCSRRRANPFLLGQGWQVIGLAYEVVMTHAFSSCAPNRPEP